MLSAPYVWLFTNTIPPARRYVLSFIACIFWIMALSYLMVRNRINVFTDWSDFVLHVSVQRNCSPAPCHSSRKWSLLLSRAIS